MEEDLKNKILKDVLRTGYPLELEIAHYFSQNSWSLIHNSYYIDKDEHKGREIDLIASSHCKNKDLENYIEVELNLIIEIKLANEKPWVIFTSPVTSFEKLMGVPFLNNCTGFKTQYPKILKLFERGTQLNERIGRSFYEAFSGNGSRDDIYKALSGTVKALVHSRQSSFINDIPKEKRTDGDRLLYYYEPVVLVKGNLFEIFLDEYKELQIERVSRSQIAFNYLSPNYKTDRFYIVNIVSLDDLPSFLNEKQVSLNNMFNKLKNLEGLK